MMSFKCGDKRFTEEPPGNLPLLVLVLGGDGG
jgi:hypothetical protein